MKDPSLEESQNSPPLRSEFIADEAPVIRHKYLMSIVKYGKRKGPVLRIIWGGILVLLSIFTEIPDMVIQFLLLLLVFYSVDMFFHWTKTRLPISKRLFIILPGVLLAWALTHVGLPIFYQRIGGFEYQIAIISIFFGLAFALVIVQVIRLMYSSGLDAKEFSWTEDTRLGRMYRAEETFWKKAFPSFSVSWYYNRDAGNWTSTEYLVKSSLLSQLQLRSLLGLTVGGLLLGLFGLFLETFSSLEEAGMIVGIFLFIVMVSETIQQSRMSKEEPKSPKETRLRFQLDPDEKPNTIWSSIIYHAMNLRVKELQAIVVLVLGAFMAGVLALVFFLMAGTALSSYAEVSILVFFLSLVAVVAFGAMVHTNLKILQFMVSKGEYGSSKPPRSYLKRSEIWIAAAVLSIFGALILLRLVILLGDPHDYGPFILMLFFVIGLGSLLACFFGGQRTVYPIDERRTKRVVLLSLITLILLPIIFYEMASIVLYLYVVTYTILAAVLALLQGCGGFLLASHAYALRSRMSKNLFLQFSIVVLLFYVGVFLGFSSENLAFRGDILWAYSALLLIAILWIALGSVCVRIWKKAEARQKACNSDRPFPPKFWRCDGPILVTDNLPPVRKQK